MSGSKSRRSSLSRSAGRASSKSSGSVSSTGRSRKRVRGSGSGTPYNPLEPIRTPANTKRPRLRRAGSATLMDRDSFGTQINRETDVGLSSNALARCETEVALSRNARALRNYGEIVRNSIYGGSRRASPLERRYVLPKTSSILDSNLWNAENLPDEFGYGRQADNLNAIEHGWKSRGTYGPAHADGIALEAMEREMERQEALERPTRFVQDRWRYLRQRPYMPIRPLTAADRAALRDTKAPPIVPTATPRNRPYDRLLARHRGGLAGQRAVVRARPARRRKK